MQDGTCPKCQSPEVYRGSSREGDGLTAGIYPSIVEIVAGRKQTTLWIDTYICRACGYLEMRIANRDELSVLTQADGWEKVAPA